MNMSERDFMKLLKSFAKTISSQSFGLIKHAPEQDAQVNTCYHNAEVKAERAGGRIQYGWTFNHRLTADFPSVGYFVAAHHAVWRDSIGRLIDVTPFNPEVKHQPLNNGGEVYFLVDDRAKPVMIEGQGAPLPMKFSPLNEGKKLKAHVENLTVKEQQKCQEYYQTIAEQVKSNQP